MCAPCLPQSLYVFISVQMSHYTRPNMRQKVPTREWLELGWRSLRVVQPN
jgi:hypothetical protein